MNAKEANELRNNMNTYIEKIGMGTKPDPFKFTIVKIEEINDNTIILANYHGCTTFGGHKLMLFRGKLSASRQTLDPHFFEGHSIVARFIPTEDGWKLARICANNI
jgi:hypothetical protein